jgi:hypothetical protein
LRFEIIRFSGGCVERVTPVPIPNTEVKPLGADGTARATAWESRKPPGLLSQSPLKVNLSGLLCVLFRIFDVTYPDFLRFFRPPKKCDFSGHQIGKIVPCGALDARVPEFNVATTIP